MEAIFQTNFGFKRYENIDICLRYKFPSFYTHIRKKWYLTIQETLLEISTEEGILFGEGITLMKIIAEEAEMLANLGTRYARSASRPIFIFGGGTTLQCSNKKISD